MRLLARATETLDLVGKHSFKEGPASAHTSRAMRAFDSGSGDAAADCEREIEKLRAKIGRLIVERDLLAKSPEDERP